MLTSLAIFFVAASAAISPAKAEMATACTQIGICYCVHADRLGEIQDHVTTIRQRLAAARATGKATGYISVPISQVGGSYTLINIEAAADMKRRLEKRFGLDALWMLNPAEDGWKLLSGASGADYMLMWTRVLEGLNGDGADFDVVYFAGPSDFARSLNLSGDNIIPQLDAEYDRRAAIDPGIRTVDKRLFRTYYAFRASGAYGLGSHDEWNIARLINEGRRKTAGGIALQWAIWFDGNPASPSQLEASAAPGYVGACLAR